MIAVTTINILVVSETEPAEGGVKVTLKDPVISGDTIAFTNELAPQLRDLLHGSVVYGALKKLGAEVKMPEDAETDPMPGVETPKVMLS